MKGLAVVSTRFLNGHMVVMVDVTFVLRDRQLQRGGAPASSDLIGPRKVRANKPITAEGRRAEFRAAKATQKPTIQQRGAIQPRGSHRSNSQPLQHESVRLQQQQQQRDAFAAESKREEQKLRQEKYAQERQLEDMVQQKMEALMRSRPDNPNDINTALARSIAAKQSGAAVGAILSAGYGYE